MNAQRNLNLESMQELFYRGQFSQLLSAASHIGLADVSLASVVELAMLRANAMFELGDVAGSKQVLEGIVAETAVRFPKQFTYVSARLRYMSGEYEQAVSLFRLLKELCAAELDKTTAFKAELGLANIAYTQRDIPALKQSLRCLANDAADMPMAEQLSYQLLLGHLAGLEVEDDRGVDKNFLQVMGLASRRGWTYFQKRALYFLVVHARRTGRSAVAESRIEILNAMIDADQDRYFAHLVQERFKAGSDLNQPMRVDPQAMIVSFGSKSSWNLYDCPQMYRFVEMLHGSQRFISKSEIAKALWPAEAYRKYVHDPRIFDLAKRLRKRIDSENLAGVSFLSGRAGYQLVLPKAS
jgi:hypothetical protein